VYMKAVSFAALAALNFFSPIVALAQSPAPAATAVPVPSVPKDTPVFHPPAGWTSEPFALAMSGFTMLSVWKAPPAFSPGDNVGLGFAAAPPGSRLTDAVPSIEAMYLRIFGAGNPVLSHAEKLCGGGADGWYFENRITFGALNITSEQTMIVGPSDMFAATYTRMSSEKEDAAARLALDTLCVKPSASPA